MGLLSVWRWSYLWCFSLFRVVKLNTFTFINYLIHGWQVKVHRVCRLSFFVKIYVYLVIIRANGESGQNRKNRKENGKTEKNDWISYCFVSCIFCLFVMCCNSVFGCLVKARENIFIFALICDWFYNLFVCLFGSDLINV